MTPEKHLELAEHHIGIAGVNAEAGNFTGEQACLLYAIAHALIAHAAESGVPHLITAPPGGESGVG